MVLPNPKKTFKALLLDYDALLAASDAECEYCLSEREVQIILGFVDYVGWKTRYIATETEIDTNLIDRWASNLARKLMSGCCGENGTQHRVTESGVWQTSQDGGATWYDDPNSDPRNNASYFAPLPGADGDDKRCIAATNAFEFMKQNLIDELSTGLAYAEIFSTIVSILGILGILGIGIIAAIITGAIFVAGVIVVQAAFTSEVWTDFKCILYCNISDDASYTVEQWEAVKTAVNDTFDGVVEIILYNWINALGHIGLTNAARSNMGLGADCSGCNCGNCSNLLNWEVIYGEILEQSPGFLRIRSTPSGGGAVACRIANYTSGETGECCAVSYDFGSSPVTNASYTPCNSTTPINSGAPQGTCLYDISFTNIFGVEIIVEFFFNDCP